MKTVGVSIEIISNNTEETFDNKLTFVTTLVTNGNNIGDNYGKKCGNKIGNKLALLTRSVKL